MRRLRRRFSASSARMRFAVSIGTSKASLSESLTPQLSARRHTSYAA
jgi:hypothetical protein